MLGKEIIIETLKQIQRDRVTATPDVYAKTFCAIAKKAGFDMDECRPAAKYIARLPEPLKTQANDRKIEQIDDLMAFIIGAILRGAALPKKDAEEIVRVMNDLLAKAMTPSFSNADTRVLSKTLDALEKDPRRIVDKLWQHKILALIVDRIRVDRVHIANEAIALKNGVENLLDLVSSMHGATKEKREKICAVSKTLDAVKAESFSKEIFAQLKARLETIALDLGAQADEFEAKLEGRETEIRNLQEQIAAMSKKIEQLSKESAEDYLTNLKNKRSLDLAFGEFENGFTQKQKDYALLFFDIDFFKRINDVYGHECGDMVLQSFGSMLKSLLPAGAAAGRYGGEEFAALLCASLGEAAAIAEKIRSEIEKSKFLCSKQTIAMTVSCGVAIRSETTGADDILRVADARLYAAKNWGRNRVVFNG
ncbi:hypothetical protein FACS189487_10580 [Campylobacterota bacterium]|nr:hypothetical protein FACS189487_10580 [Campylobacterota bacterium]